VVTDEPGPTPAKMLDIEMLVMTVGGKERTKDEFAELRDGRSVINSRKEITVASTLRPPIDKERHLKEERYDDD
jgi:hypothetical protein